MKPQYNQNPSTPQNDTGTLLSSNLYYYRNVGANFKDENEFKHRYDNQLQANSSLAKRVKELEVELQSTNTRYDEMKDKLLKEIESEKQLRKETETSSMAQIEKYIKSETELKQQYLDLKNKYYEQSHQLKELQEKVCRSFNPAAKKSCSICGSKKLFGLGKLSPYQQSEWQIIQRK